MNADIIFMRNKSIAFTFLFLSAVAAVTAQDLSLTGQDLRIELKVDGGYHLYIRKKAGLNSVLLTESTRDPSGAADNYAYRAAEWNPINGDEIRYLDGEPISKDLGLWSLIDSTPEPDAVFGQAFHIWIPYLISYGYEYSRHGETYVVDGTYLNVRCFELPFGDYRGAFQDNPFLLAVSQKELAGPPEGNFMADTVEAFSDLATAGKGEIVFSTGPEDLVPKIEKIIENAKGKSLDLVLALDATASMKDDIDSVREKLIPMLEELIGGFTSFRIGLVLYKDYYDDFLTKTIKFTSNFTAFQKSLNAIRVYGGRDIPEAVHEALYEAVTAFPWGAEERLIILIGDAPPHPKPRGKITKAMVDEAAEKRDLRVNVIILPQ